MLSKLVLDDRTSEFIRHSFLSGTSNVCIMMGVKGAFILPFKQSSITFMSGMVGSLTSSSSTFSSKSGFIVKRGVSAFTSIALTWNEGLSWKPSRALKPPQQIVGRYGEYSNGLKKRYQMDTGLV